MGTPVFLSTLRIPGQCHLLLCRDGSDRRSESEGRGILGGVFGTSDNYGSAELQPMRESGPALGTRPTSGPTKREVLAQTVGTTLYFAGEATHNTTPSTVPGALQSGERAGG